MQILKSSVRKAAFVLFLVILLSYTLYVLSSYFDPKLLDGRIPDETYNVSQENMYRDVFLWSVLPFESKVIEEVIPTKIDNELHVEFKEKYTLHLDKSNKVKFLNLTFELGSHAFLPVSSINDYEATYNKEPILLSIHDGELCSPFQISGCNILPSYFIPDLILLQNEVENELHVSYTYKKQKLTDPFIKVPLFFKKTNYVYYVDIPMETVFISTAYPYSTYDISYEFNEDDRTILMPLSGFQAWHFKKSYMDWEPKILYPIDSQNKKVNSGIFTSTTLINESISPHAFHIYFMPSVKIFLFPLIFLWIPVFWGFIYIYYLEYKEKKKHALSLYLIPYIIIISCLGLSAININNLPDFFNRLILPFNFYPLYFIIILVLFPLAYLRLYSKYYLNFIKNKSK